MGIDHNSTSNTTTTATINGNYNNNHDNNEQLGSLKTTTTKKRTKTIKSIEHFVQLFPASEQLSCLSLSLDEARAGCSPRPAPLSDAWRGVHLYLHANEPFHAIQKKKKRNKKNLGGSHVYKYFFCYCSRLLWFFVWFELKNVKRKGLLWVQERFQMVWPWNYEALRFGVETVKAAETPPLSLSTDPPLLRLR